MEKGMIDHGTMDHGTMEHGVMEHGAIDRGITEHGVMEHGILNTQEQGQTPQSVLTAATVDENKFKPDMVDFSYAVFVFVLGYFFSSWVLFTWRGWGVAVFTSVYLFAATRYLAKKDSLAKSKEMYFWMIVTLLTGVSYALWDNLGLARVRGAFLFCSAVYYVIVASGRTIMGETGNFLLLDALNAVVIIPFGNFLNQYVSIKGLRVGSDRHKNTVSIALGLVLAVFLVLCLNPLLSRADSGGFRIVSEFLATVLTIPLEYRFNVVTNLFLAFPIAAYIYGLFSGVAHEKATSIIKPESAKRTATALRIFQPMTVHIALGAVCGLYLVFIFSQVPYFFSAFTGNRPVGWLIYSNYARQGFFELCRIASINLVLVLLGNVMCNKQDADMKRLKTLNSVLAIITLVLIATAVSKMALYISAYGLTMRRLLPCVFMIFLAAVFVALIILQRKDFSILRFALVVGSAMLCALFVSNPDAAVVRYNTNRYLSGTLAEYDGDLLYSSGSAGLGIALFAYESIPENDNARYNINRYIQYVRGNINRMYSRSLSIWGGGANERNLEYWIAKRLLNRHGYSISGGG